MRDRQFIGRHIIERRSIRACFAGATLAVALASAAPAFAQDSVPGAPPPAGMPDTRPEWKGAPPYPYQGAQQSYGMDPRARADWLTECRRRAGYRDDGVGGAIIGGLVGGVAGNRIAGRRHRTVGTVAGAAVGAAAGMAIDKAEDRGRSRDECEAYLDDYYARAGAAYAGYGYPGAYGYGAYGYAPASACCGAPMMMVPVMMQPRGEPRCTETVEYIEEPVRPRARVIPRRAVPDKRIRVAPDKRVRVNK